MGYVAFTIRARADKVFLAANVIRLESLLVLCIEDIVFVGVLLENKQDPLDLQASQTKFQAVYGAFEGVM